MLKNLAERSRPRMTIWRMRIACWIHKATNTLSRRLWNTHCFPTAKMVARTRLYVTLYLHCVSCLKFTPVDLPRQMESDLVSKSSFNCKLSTSNVWKNLSGSNLLCPGLLHVNSLFYLQVFALTWFRRVVCCGDCDFRVIGMLVFLVCLDFDKGKRFELHWIQLQWLYLPFANAASLSAQNISLADWKFSL
jgi:hypothetical protein